MGLGTNEKDGAKTEAKTAEPPPTPISIVDFAKIDLRTGTVTAAERIVKSNKLLKLQIDVGEPTPRQVVAGLGKTFEPEKLVGSQVVVVVNLAPVELMGVPSNGMVLASGPDDEHRVLVQVPGATNGSTVK